MALGKYRWLITMAVMINTISKPLSAAVVVANDMHGSLELSSSRRSATGGSSEITNQMAGAVSTKYYLWQPWLVTGDAELNFGLSENRIQETTKKHNILTGRLSSSVLPMSTIPLSLSYSRKDSRIISDQNSLLSMNPNLLLDENLTVEHIFINQRVLGKSYKADLNISNNDDMSSINGETKSRGYGLGLLNRWKKSDLTTKISSSDQNNSVNNEGKKEKLATISHNYYPSESLQFRTFASIMNRDDSVFNNSNNLELYKTRVSQLSASSNWRSKDKKTRINGGVSANNLELSSPSINQLYRSANFRIGIDQSFNKNWSGNLSLDYLLSSQNSDKISGTDVKSKIRYQSDKKKLKGFYYRWNSEITAENNWQNSVTKTSYGGVLAHDVVKEIKLNKGQKITISGSQGVSQSIIVGGPESLSVTHGGNAAWIQSSPGVNNSIQLSVNDRRYRTATERSGTTFIRMSLTSKKMLSRRSSISGGLSHNISYYDTTVTGGGTKNRTTSCNANYQITKALLYQVVSFKSGVRYQSSANSYTPSTLDWNSSAKYSIGKLGVIINYRLRDVGKKMSLFTINIRRNF